MSKVKRIEHDVQALTPEELAAFRQWFREFDAEAWDRQVEKDAKAGKLDTVADTALKAFKSGKCSEL